MEKTRKLITRGDRYLSFALHNEEYCIPIVKVKEIMGMTTINRIPQTPAFIKGVINLRGRIVPIIDLRARFGMQTKDYTDRTCIVVIDLSTASEEVFMGVVVDTIQEVVAIPPESISEVPYVNARIKSEYISGIAEFGERIKILLDIAKVLSEREFEQLREIEATDQQRRQE